MIQRNEKALSKLKFKISYFVFMRPFGTGLFSISISLHFDGGCSFSFTFSKIDFQSELCLL